MKYRLTEEQLNSLIAESTIRVLIESSEDEGIGGAIGKGLGWVARKTADGFKDFGKNFGQQWNGQVQGQGQETSVGNGQQSLQQVQQQIQALKQQLNSLQQIVNNGGGNKTVEPAQATQQQAAQPKAAQPQAAQPKNKRVIKNNIEK
jgi:hypothetical protein